MKRTVLAVALGLALSLLAACGEERSAGPAAIVNGEEINHRSVVDELQAIAGNEAFLALVESATPVTGKAEGSFNAAFAAEVLTNQIFYELIDQELATRDVELDDECRNAGETDLLRNLADDQDAAQEILDAFPSAFREELVARQAEVAALQGALIDQPCVTDEDAVAAYYESHRDEFEQVCASHILVATRPEAETVLTDLAAGADFATLARERSTDTMSGAEGGDLGCAFRGSYVPEFEDAVYSAALNQPTGPVETQFGFHVVLVRERGIPDLDEVRDEAARTLAQLQSESFSGWLQSSVAASEITVDPRYGVWEPATGTITAPEAGETTTTASP